MNHFSCSPVHRERLQILLNCRFWRGCRGSGTRIWQALRRRRSHWPEGFTCNSKADGGTVTPEMRTHSCQPWSQQCCVLVCGLSAQHRRPRCPQSMGIISVCDTETQLGIHSSSCSQMLWEGFIPSQQEGHWDDSGGERCQAGWHLQRDPVFYLRLSPDWILLPGTKIQSQKSQ